MPASIDNRHTRIVQIGTILVLTAVVSCDKSGLNKVPLSSSFAHIPSVFATVESRSFWSNQQAGLGGCPLVPRRASLSLPN